MPTPLSGFSSRLGPKLRRNFNFLRDQGIRRLSAKLLHRLRSRYSPWVKRRQLTPSKINAIKREIAAFHYLPQISILMPVFNVDEKWLQRAISSVKDQIYPHWELCLVDDASSKPHIRPALEAHANGDSRIKVKILEQNQGIAGASNHALAMACGDFIGLLDDDDELSRDALFEVVKLLNLSPGIDMIYSDEDKMELNGKRCDPFFKPDWSPDMLLSCMYTCHFGVFRHRLMTQIGGFRSGFEGVQDYDLVLRFTEKTTRIYHIPKILYHWRKIPGSLALTTDSKRHAYPFAIKALKDAMRRRNVKAEVVPGKWIGAFRVRYKFSKSPKISIIIGTRDQPILLGRCIQSLFKNNHYSDFEILIIDNGSKRPETKSLLSELNTLKRVRVQSYPQPFNFSAINNFGVRNSKGSLLLFLNDDCEVKAAESLSALAEHAQRDKIGAVGARLLYPDHTLQHCGIILGLGADGIAGHHSYHYPETDDGYFGRNAIVHNVSAVTAAAMMVKKSAFEAAGGFDQKLARAYNDVDLCLTLKHRGLLNLYTPYAEFWHHESATRGDDQNAENSDRFQNEAIYFRSKWKNDLSIGDPYYNPNLTLKRVDFSVRI